VTAAGETRPGTECDRSALYGAPVVDREDPLDVFASARISVSGALIGALLAEWPATGQGIGSGMLTLIAGFRHAEVWASVGCESFRVTLSGDHAARAGVVGVVLAE
jgi:hypothetical protein